MNELDARSVRVRGGFHGKIRKVHRADYEKVCVNGKPVLFDSHEQAEIAAWRVLKGHLCGDLDRSGDKANAARSEAEKLFGKVFPGKGRRSVVVERR